MTQDRKTRAATGSVELLARRRKDQPADQCVICTAYARQRGDRIRSEIRRTTPAEHRLDRWVAFMAGVHARHLDLARSAMARVAHTTSTTEETR